MHIITLELMKVELELGLLIKVVALTSRNDLLNSINDYKKKYKDKNNVPRPNHWSGWNLKPLVLNFGLMVIIGYMKG